jgi:hypothetical protein
VSTTINEIGNGFSAESSYAPMLALVCQILSNLASTGSVILAILATQKYRWGVGTDTGVGTDAPAMNKRYRGVS